MNDLQPTGGARFGSADLQVHTSHGDGMADARAIFDRVESTTDLDVIAITDHDDIAGALLARDMHARGHYRFAFIPGIEVTTRSGHLLALWVDQPVPSFRSLAETVATIHRLGGLAVIPHPFSYLTRSIGQRTLDRLLADADPETRPDGIEVANLTLAGRVTGAKARRWNRDQIGIEADAHTGAEDALDGTPVGRLAETGGSDTHFPEEVGNAWTIFPGTTPAELRSAILARTTRGRAGTPLSLRQIGVRRILAQQVRGLSVTPRVLLGRALRRLTRAEQP